MVTWTSKINDHLDAVDERIEVYRMTDGSRRRYLRPVTKDVGYVELVKWPTDRWASIRAERQKKFRLITESNSDFYTDDLYAAVYYGKNIREPSSVYCLSDTLNFCDWGWSYGGAITRGESKEKILKLQEAYGGDIVELEWSNPRKVAECVGKITQDKYKIILNESVEAFFPNPSSAYKHLKHLDGYTVVVKEDVDLDVEYEYKVSISSRDIEFVNELASKYPDAQIIKIIRKIR